MYFLLWFKRFFLSSNNFLSFTPLTSILSIILAVSCLVLGMSVYSGYEATVKKAILDMTSHLVISARQPEGEVQLIRKIKQQLKSIKAYSTFLHLRSLLVYDGRLSGVLLEGVDPHTIHQTIDIKKRLMSGTFHLKQKNSAVVGMSLAKKFHLKPGVEFHIIVPGINDASGAVTSKHQKLTVEGVVDFGFYEFNSRQIFTNMSTVQDLMGKGKVISGLRLFLPDVSEIDLKQLQGHLMNTLGVAYQVSRWGGLVKSISESYFQAIQKEKFLIFFILMTLVLAGSFNVASHLSISVLNRIREISILRTIGASSFFVARLFIAQGILISFIGTIFGIIFGFLLSKGLMVVQYFWEIVPPHVYQVHTITTDVQWGDLVLIMLCSQLICFLMCVWPVIKIFKLSLTEGLVSE